MNKDKSQEVFLPVKLLRQVGKAISKFKLIDEGDNILLGLSGGKDSTLLALVFKHLQKHSLVKFNFHAVTVLYGMGENFEKQKKFFDEHNIPHSFQETEIFDLAKTKINKNSSFCSFFSRMRRGSLSESARKFKCNKIALAHHLDDAVESFMMGFMYNGIMRSMAPKYTTESGDIIIRPFSYVREEFIREIAKKNNIPAVGDEMCPGMIMPNAKMPHTREYTKNLLKKMESENPSMFDSMRKALSNIDQKTFFI